MNKSVRNSLVMIAVLIAMAATVVVVNQTIQFSEFIGTIHTGAGHVVLWTMFTVYLILLIVPAVLFMKLPGALTLPDDEDSEEYRNYLKQLSRRLELNKSVSKSKIETEEELKAALKEIDERCLKLVKKAGSRTFIFTAISQFGALDTMMVVATQTKMIWEIAHLYYQRPTIKDLWFLYSNVITTAFITGELNDVDFAEVVQPIISKTLGSAGTLIPGTSLFVNSVFTGTTNAFLMLRIGIITRNYCGSLVKKERGTIRRSALAESATLLSEIALEGARDLSVTMVKATGKTVSNAVSDAGKSLVSSGKKIVEGFTQKK